MTARTTGQTPLIPATVRRPLTAAVAAGVGTMGVMVMDPVRRHVPLCPFHAATGLQCPLCGGLRAVQALMHGDVMTALHGNLLFVASLPLLGVLWLDALHRGRTGRPRRVLPRWTPFAVVGVAVVFTVVRNLPGAQALRPVT